MSWPLKIYTCDRLIKGSNTCVHLITITDSSNNSIIKGKLGIYLMTLICLQSLSSLTVLSTCFHVMPEKFSERKILKMIILTCIESALSISPLNFSAISMASFDFPVPVAPKITTTGSLLTSFLAAAIVDLTDAPPRRAVGTKSYCRTVRRRTGYPFPPLSWDGA